MKSEKRSFENWSFKEWLIGNKKSIKEVLKIGTPLIIGWITTQNPGLTGLITAGGKLVIDTAEYWFKQQN